MSYETIEELIALNFLEGFDDAVDFLGKGWGVPGVLVEAIQGELSALRSKEEVAIDMIVNLRAMNLRLARALAKYPQSEELVKQSLGLLNRLGISPSPLRATSR